MLSHCPSLGFRKASLVGKEDEFSLEHVDVKVTEKYLCLCVCLSVQVRFRSLKLREELRARDSHGSHQHATVNGAMGVYEFLQDKDIQKKSGPVTAHV